MTDQSDKAALEPARAVYDDATAAARAQYNKAYDAGQAAFDETVTPAYAAFAEARAKASAEHDKAVAPAQAVFNKAVAKVRAERERRERLLDEEAVFDLVQAARNMASHLHWTEPEIEGSDCGAVLLAALAKFPHMTNVDEALSAPTRREGNDD